MADNRDIAKAARALARDPNATAHDLRGALKGMLSLYDEINGKTFSGHGDMVSVDPAPHAAADAPLSVGKTYKL